MRLNIRAKLYLAFGLVLLLVLATTMYLFNNIKNAQNSYTELLEDRAYVRYLAATTMTESYSTASSLRAYILRGDPNDALVAKEALDEIDSKLNEIKPLLVFEEAKQLHSTLRDDYESFREFALHLIELIDQREASADQDKELAQKQVMDHFTANSGIVGELAQAGNALALFATQALDQGISNNTAAINRTITISSILIVITILLGLTAAYAVGRIIANPISLVNAEAAKVAAGDLTSSEIKIANKDEIGQLAASFNTMLANLKDVAAQLQEKSNSVASSADQLSAGAQNVSAVSTETAASITEISSTVEQVATNAQNVAEISVKTSDQAIEGEQAVNDVQVTMDAINQATEANGELIQSLNDSAEQIGKIVDFITQVADQTNLLALNAAIEAARAGEHGRGFAVVAEEVRELAEQSTNAAQDIYTLITTIQQQSNQAVTSMTETKTKVGEGTTVAQDVAERIGGILDSVQTIANEIQSVAAATEQVTATAENIAAAAEEQTATMEEVSATSQDLASVAQELDTIAHRFKLS